MITDYFEERGIDYWTSGKNVSQGWVNIQCVFCNDHSNHLGIKIQNRTGYFNCWLCKEHGSLHYVIMQIEKCSYREAQQIIQQYDLWEVDFSLDFVEKTKLPPSLQQSEVNLPPILNKWPKKYLNYLEGRQFDPIYLIKKYKLMPAHRFGRYSHRIIAPFFVDRKMVAFTGIRTKEGQEPPYKDCSKQDAVIYTDETLYNIDNIKNNNVVIVEGITDVWRIGDGAVALGTNKMSDSQLLQIFSKGVNRALVLLDADAKREAEIISYMLNANIVDVDTGYLNKNDPDKMNDEDLLRVRKWLS